MADPSYLRVTDERLERVHADLRARVLRPQRHRLLHGYPMAPLLRPLLQRRVRPHERMTLDPTRPLIVGVIPHTFCNPAVRGCGFCTFAHEKYSNDAARAVVGRVIDEVRAIEAGFPEARERRVDALYFGGGTANLTPPDALGSLASVLAETFDLSGAEVTLEGVPVYFTMRGEAMLDVLSSMPVRHRRISMGVQSFDPVQLARMGRSAFGGPAEIAATLRSAHARDMTSSCDLLYGLPDQTLEACLDDVARACELGFDQICVYNLVLEEGMGTEWSRSPAMLAGLADNDTRCSQWLAIRRSLLDAGYEQTTLTNFERAAVARTDRRFVYEDCSFQPASYDALGLGPGAISTFTSHDRTTATKWMNEPTADGFMRRLDGTGSAAASLFRYSLEDLKLLHVTRQLARLGIDRAAYVEFFDTDVVADHSPAIEALVDDRLLHVTDTIVSITPEGMFHADAVAGLLAADRAAVLRDANDAVPHAMG